jgi:hypothetical protein
MIFISDKNGRIYPSIALISLLWALYLITDAGIDKYFYLKIWAFTIAGQPSVNWLLDTQISMMVES